MSRGRATLIAPSSFAAAIGLALIVLQVAARHRHLPLMVAIREYRRGQSYFVVRIWSAPFVFANLVMLGWFHRACPRRQTALALQVAITGSMRRYPAAGAVIRLRLSGAAAGALAGEANRQSVAVSFSALRAVVARLPPQAGAELPNLRG